MTVKTDFLILIPISSGIFLITVGVRLRINLLILTVNFLFTRWQYLSTLDTFLLYVD